METSNSQSVRVPWYRTSIAWLGIGIFLASIAGSVWLIVVSMQYRDVPLGTPTQSVLGVPVHDRPAPASS